jgi:hypothetical protein
MRERILREPVELGLCEETLPYLLLILFAIFVAA